MSLRGRLVDAGFWFGWNTLWVMPESMARALFDIVGRVTWRLNGRGARQLEANIARAMGDAASPAQVRAASHRALRHYMRYYCETFLLPRWSPERISQAVRADNLEPVAAAARAGGVILTLPHSGNWDLAGAWAAQHLGQIVTVAERLRPEGVFQKFLRVRRALGITLMPLTGEPGVYEFLRASAVSGAVVPLLGDRDVARSGMGVEFFGHRAPMPVGAALIALDTGLPLFTCCTYYEGATLVIRFGPQVPLPAARPVGRERLRLGAQVTGLIASAFEQDIREHPDSWYQLQPVWPDLVVDT